VYTLPFPGNGQQSRFIRGLVEVLKRHIKGEIPIDLRVDIR
jgi:hypothetical protein